MSMIRAWLLFGAVFLLLLSSWPIFLMLRETYMNQKILARYETDHVDTSQGFSASLDTQHISFKGIDIDLVEIPTGKTAPLTVHDEYENVEPGEIVQLQWYVNGQPVSSADEIWLSNRGKGARYYSWLDVLQVKDRRTKTEKLALVQRLTDDDAPMDSRAWKIIWVEMDGSITEEQLTYADRSSNPLGVHIVSHAGTTLMGMGYYSDLMHVYPSLFYPILYPGMTVLLGLLFLLLGVFLHFWKVGRGNVVDPLP